MSDTQKIKQQHSTSARGVAGKIAKGFIDSQMTPLFLIMTILIGVVGMIMTPRQEDPQISVPMADIFVNYPGASAKQVEAMVSEPMERLLKEIKGVKHVYSVSKRGQGLITVEFRVGEKNEDALVKLYNKIASNSNLMPAGVQPPLIKTKTADDVPLVTATLSSKALDGNQLRLLGLDVLQSLGEIHGAAQGFVVGGEPNEIKVEVNPERLASYGLPLSQIGHVIKLANSETQAGNLETDNRIYNVYTGDFLKSVDDVKNLIVGVKGMAPVYVRDVAKVVESPKTSTRLVKFYTGQGYHGKRSAPDGRDAVTIAIAKKPGANGVSVAQDILHRLDSLKGQLIPSDVDVSISRDYGVSANDKVNHLILKLFIATGAVTLLTGIFLGWRAGAVIAIAIPSVILSTVFAAWLLGFTIDRVSLFALIFSIGILVDDAVVVLENIYRRWLMSNSTDNTVTIDAVSEVGNPTIIATFAVVAALVPMGFVRGMMGPYMAPIPVLGSVAMFISLFVAFAFIPWLAKRIKPNMVSLKKAEEKEHRQSETTERFFRKLLGSLLVEKQKGLGFLIGIVLAFVISVFFIYKTWVPVKLLPFDNKSDISVIINYPEGTALPVTENMTHKLVKALQTFKEVKTLETYVGTAAPFDFNGLVRHYYLRQSPWLADIQIHLVDKSAREDLSHTTAEAMRVKLREIVKGTPARIQIVEMPPGPPVLQSVVAEVYGPTEKARAQAARELTHVFNQASDLSDVDNFLTAPHYSWRFVVDKQKALESGVSLVQINQTLRMTMGNYTLGDIKQGFVRESTNINLEVPLSMRSEFSRLGSIPIPSQQGGTVPLSELGSFKRELEQNIIYHKDLRPVDYVTANGIGRLGAPIYGMLQVDDLLKKEHSALTGNFIEAPQGLSTGFKWAGEWTVTYETFRDMGMAFGIALIAIYMLVVWEFKNFLVPLIVMAPIPLTLIGIIPGHWLFGAEFTATSMIGFIALAGIIVRNSILLVDFSRHEIEAGTPVTDAVIYACKARTRPILITAAALIMGSSVILFDPIFQGMAISLMFGVLVATLLTLVVIPLGCVSARTAFCPAVVGTAQSACANNVSTAQQAQSSSSVTATSAEISPEKNAVNAEQTSHTPEPTIQKDETSSEAGTLGEPNPASQRIKNKPASRQSTARAKTQKTSTVKRVSKKQAPSKKTPTQSSKTQDDTTEKKVTGSQTTDPSNIPNTDHANESSQLEKNPIGTAKKVPRKRGIKLKDEINKDETNETK